MADERKDSEPAASQPMAAHTAQARVAAVDAASSRPSAVIVDGVCVAIFAASAAAAAARGARVVVGDGPWSLGAPPPPRTRTPRGACSAPPAREGDVLEVHVWDAPPAGTALTASVLVGLSLG